VNAQHILWAIAGAAVAYVMLNRRRAGAAAKAASIAAGEALVPALTDAHADDGPDSELDTPCCAKCAAKDGVISVDPVPTVSLAAPATRRMPRGPIKIYMGGGRARPLSRSGAIITQKLGSGGTLR